MPVPPGGSRSSSPGPALGSERALAALWRRAGGLSAGLVTEDGRRFRVVYPGRASGRAGPDFRDAVLASDDGTLLTGDVELHLDGSDWRRHGHEADPAYSGVVLHVVLRPRGVVVSRQRSGTHIRVASLGGSLEELAGLEETPGIASWRPPLGRVELEMMLERAGDQRFQAKSRGFVVEMAVSDPEEVAYRAVMEALGYSSNRKPFRELAVRLPMEVLALLRSEPPSARLLGLRAALMGASGLLGLVEPPHERELLRRLLKLLPRRGPMPSSRWTTFRVRPANHPVRRVEGAARLVDRYIESGFVAGLEGLARGADAEALVGGLAVPPYVGRVRAIELAVNVALPFVHARAGLRRDRALARSCVELYYRLPETPANEITREARRLLSIGTGREGVRGARGQQGLIQVYRAMLGRAVAGPSAAGVAIS